MSGFARFYSWGFGFIVLVSIGVYVGFFMDPVLARVGTTKIYRSDVKFRDQIIFLSFPNEKRSMGLHQLIKSATNFEILKNHGISFPDTVIDLEEARIDRDTRSPEQLQKIKNIFGDDKQAYRRVYVLPTLVDRVIYFEFFLTDEKIHGASMRQAMDLISKLRGHEAGFRDVATSNGFRVQKLTVSLKDGVTWDLPKLPGEPPKAPQADTPSIIPTESANEEAKKWYELFIQNLKVGEVAAIPISYGNDLLVAHYLKNPRSSVFNLEVAVLPKLEFGPWLEQEKAKIKIDVYDKTYLPSR